jgi:2-(1,2-epoxy-1,2-dihydrophenyl)acetyl-CoA isomerase
MSESIKLEKAGNATVVFLDRPETYNAFDLEMIRSLGERLAAIALDPKTIGIVITGRGKAFCAGGDLRWAASHGPSAGAAFHELAAHYHMAIQEIRRMPKPVVAALNGIAAGGGFSLALACDFRVMERQASLKQAYTSSGLSLDGGGSFSLPRMVGLAKALEIAAFDRPISAEQALSWGLVTEIVDPGTSVQRALEMVEDLARRSHSSFAASKKLLTDAFDTPFEAQLEKERELLSQCADHPNGREGLAAFVEKRKAVFNQA